MTAELIQTPAELREQVLKLEAVMLAMPQIEIPIEHFFAPGIYMRQMTMPEGSTVVGKIHKHEHYCILSKGKVSVVTGDSVKTFDAPAVIHAKPGAKRALHALSEVVWVNVHSNPGDERDPDKIDELFVVDTFEQFYLTSNRTYEDALKMIGVTKEEATTVSENPDDQIPYPVEPASICIADSPIHGKGVFAVARIEKGGAIAPARIGGKRTPAGRYCNHGGIPNAETVMRENGDVDLIALESIEAGTEILTDYYKNYANSRFVALKGEK